MTYKHYKHDCDVWQSTAMHKPTHKTQIANTKHPKQEETLVAPTDAENLPALHDTHASIEMAPGMEENLPAMQKLQSDASLTEYFPAGHG